MLLQTNTILLFANTMLLNLQKVGHNAPICAIRKKKSVIVAMLLLVYFLLLFVKSAWIVHASNTIYTSFMLIS